MGRCLGLGRVAVTGSLRRPGEKRTDVSVKIKSNGPRIPVTVWCGWNRIYFVCVGWDSCWIAGSFVKQLMYNYLS